MIKLIELCVRGCKFMFGERYYEQKSGMAMGNPLSPLLSNLYMEFFESKYLPRILPKGILWVRYVDDIFCAWPVDKNEESFLTALHTLVPSIKFTLETEVDNKLAFLDVLIVRNDRNKVQLKDVHSSMNLKIEKAIIQKTLANLYVS